MRYYTDEHEWIEVEGDIATVGITDYAQGQLGDIVFVELPEVGALIEQGKDARIGDRRVLAGPQRAEILPDDPRFRPEASMSRARATISSRSVCSSGTVTSLGVQSWRQAQLATRSGNIAAMAGAVGCALAQALAKQGLQRGQLCGAEAVHGLDSCGQRLKRLALRCKEYVKRPQRKQVTLLKMVTLIICG